ncbi:hypothetical protein PPERSA_11278 [Pseudocohnilembus persalinus]|uniref:C2H2-type domain-containing protein n=1 Tax=Pseudocohnilembus persalinus TaxID=266149 RepID=A0A0V0QQ30_PSEPJ|nr:hypothetical protein PPERSA_11278 [Pseudocohnilembus persalinus]|eukprot:KRX04154.1 hypothetical protein PPERSA_11278 [Pseudocohnilembus persalinus]
MNRSLRHIHCQIDPKQIESREEEFKKMLEDRQQKKDKYPSYVPYSKENKKYRYKSNQKKCQLCSKNFSSKYTAITHLKIVHGKNPFICKKCLASFNTMKDLKDHIEFEHIHKSQVMEQEDQLINELKKEVSIEKHSNLDTQDSDCQGKDYSKKSQNLKKIKKDIDLIEIIVTFGQQKSHNFNKLQINLEQRRNDILCKQNKLKRAEYQDLDEKYFNIQNLIPYYKNCKEIISTKKYDLKQMEEKFDQQTKNKNKNSSVINQKYENQQNDQKKNQLDTILESQNQFSNYLSNESNQNEKTQMENKQQQTQSQQRILNNSISTICNLKSYDSLEPSQSCEKQQQKNQEVQDQIQQKTINNIHQILSYQDQNLISQIQQLQQKNLQDLNNDIYTYNQMKIKQLLKNKIYQNNCPQQNQLASGINLNNISSIFPINNKFWECQIGQNILQQQFNVKCEKK